MALKSLPPRLAAPAYRLPVQAGSEQERSRVRDAVLPWRKWYKTARWRALRMQVFVRDLFRCQMRGCNRVTSDTSQLVCDHVRPHRGDETLFWDTANLQTLCKPCHDREKQIAEARAARRG